MPIQIADIVAEAAARGAVTVEQIMGRSRVRPVTLARHKAIWAARRLIPHLSTPSLGRYIGQLDHSTVIHACQHIDQLRLDDPFERVDTDELIEAVAPGYLATPAELETVDKLLVEAALAGMSVQAAALHAFVPLSLAHSRLTVIAHAAAASIGRGLVQAGLHVEPAEPLETPFLIAAPCAELEFVR